MSRRLGLWFLGFCPQFRTGRRFYARETVLGLLFAWGLWMTMDPVADATFISDEALVWIGRLVYPLFINLLLVFMTMSAARRLHDIGHGGAWALLMLMPGLNVLLVLYLLIRPGSCRPTGWRRLEDL